MGVAVGLTTRGGGSQSYLERARGLMRRNILIDTHNDLPWAFRDLEKVRVCAFATASLFFSRRMLFFLVRWTWLLERSTRQ